jgi:Cd2+/Zn2+-exporting ATPase
MKSVKLQNLHCANCALKIEKKLNELEELNNVSLNFSTATLSFEKNVKHDVLEKIEKEIQKIEKDVVIKDEEKIQKTFWQLLNKKLLLITYLLLYS